MGAVALVQTCESLEDRVLLAGVASGDILVTDHDLDAVVIVDPNTGDREILSGDPSGANVGTGPNFSTPNGIAFVDKAQIYVTDEDVDAVFRVDGTTGNREIVSIGPADAATAGVSAVGTGVEFGGNNGIVVDDAGEFAYVTDFLLDAVIQVDLRPGATFGNRLIVSDNTTPDGTNPFNSPLGTTFDATGRLLVADINAGQLLRIDNVTPGAGARTVVSDNSTPDGTNPFSAPVSVAVEGSGNLLVTDEGNDTLFRVDPTNGARTILSNNTTPNGTNPFSQPTGVAVEADGDILVVDRGLDSVFRVDPTTGARTILSGSGNGTGPAFITPDLGITVVTDDHTNSAAGATPIAVPSTTDGVTEVAGDDDFFKVSLTAGTAYLFETILGTNTDTRLELLDTDGTTRLAFDDGFPFPATEEIIFVPTVSGDYFLNVDGFDTNTGTYMLDVSELPPDDHGNTAATATPVAVPSTTNGETEFVGDLDFFMVSLIAGVTYDFEIIWGTHTDTTLELLDTDGTTQIQFEDEISTPETITFTPTVSGDYFLNVGGWDTTTGTYMLDVSASFPPDDHGNIAATATPVAVPSTTSGEIEFNGDPDVFSVNLMAGTEYRFLTILGTLGESALRLFDIDGTTELDFDRDGGPGSSSVICFTPTVTGMYFLQVTEDGNNATGTYMLDVSVVVDDHGDDHTTATPVGVSSKTDGEIEVPEDDDFFQVSLMADVEYTFETVLGTLTDTVLTLFDVDGTTLLDTNDDIAFLANLASRIVFTPVLNGDYFLKVEGFGNETGTYMLDVHTKVVQVIDDGDPGFAIEKGPWGTGNAGANGDNLNASTSGNKIASWTFDGLLPGQYRVAVTWAGNAARASDAPFTVFSGPSPFFGLNALATVDVNQQVAPTGSPQITDLGVAWQDLGKLFSVTGHELVVKLTNDANGFVMADAVRIERVADLPKIIDDGDPGFAIETGSWGIGGVGAEGDNRNASIFGGTKVARWSFTNLTPGQYRVSATWVPSAVRATDAPYTIFNGGSIIRTVDVNQQVAPSGSPELTDLVVPWQDLGGLVNITGNALHVKLTNVANGYVMADAIRIERIADLPVIIDDGDPGFAIETGSWGTGTAGANGDNRNASTIGGLKVARWAFTGLAPGQYRVYATWAASPVRATDAPFTIFDGTNILDTIDVNQQAAPSGSPQIDDLGVPWQALGGPFTITGDKLIVKLSNIANGYVMADAIRIERIGP